MSQTQDKFRTLLLQLVTLIHKKSLQIYQINNMFYVTPSQT